ncbi:MAG: DUF4199 domain-containing protein [Chitinophagia bacterium]|nr:DUF4199 domain-containing protein [Chitinophagia bacterium]
MTTTASTPSKHITYGTVAGISMVVVMLILHITGLAYANKIYNNIAWIPFLMIMILNAISYSNSLDNYVTFGQVFGNSFKAAMVTTLIIIAYSVLTIFVFPEMKEKAMGLVQDEMMKQGKVDEATMDKAMSITRNFYPVILISSSVFTGLFYGALFALIGALVAKKKGNNPHPNLDALK